MNLILQTSMDEGEQHYLSDNLYTECCYYPESRQLVVINNTNTQQTTSVKTENGILNFTIQPYDTVIEKI